MVNRIVVVVHGDGHLFQVVTTLDSGSGLAHLLHGRYEQADQHRDGPDDQAAQGSQDDAGDGHSLSLEAAAALTDVVKAEDAEDDRRDAREDDGTEGHQAQDQSRNRLAAGPLRRNWPLVCLVVVPGMVTVSRAAGRWVLA